MRLNFIAVTFLAVVFTSPAAAEKRVALVVGNSAYQSVPRLDNPRNDALWVGDTLNRLGFTLVGGGAQVDLDKTQFDSVVQRFGNQLIGADVALFYYAGHGLQVRGTNYLVPVTANPTRETDVDFQMVDVALVLRQMEGAGTKLNLVILDACRNNPFGGRGLRAADGGLAQIRAPEGTLLSYATQPGNVALDGADGHSPYTRALVETMQKPGLDILQTFNQVGLIVKRAQRVARSSHGSPRLRSTAHSTFREVQPVKSQRPVQRQAFCHQQPVPPPSYLRLLERNQISSFPIPKAVFSPRTISEGFQKTTCALPEMKSLLEGDAISTLQTSRHDSASFLGTYPTRGIPNLIPSSKQT
jgi:hypothetical protein